MTNSSGKEGFNKKTNAKQILKFCYHCNKAIIGPVIGKST